MSDLLQKERTSQAVQTYSSDSDKRVTRKQKKDRLQKQTGKQLGQRLLAKRKNKPSSADLQFKEQFKIRTTTDKQKERNHRIGNGRRE